MHFVHLTRLCRKNQRWQGIWHCRLVASNIPSSKLRLWKNLEPKCRHRVKSHNCIEFNVAQSHIHDMYIPQVLFEKTRNIMKYQGNEKLIIRNELITIDQNDRIKKIRVVHTYWCAKFKDLFKSVHLSDGFRFNYIIHVTTRKKWSEFVVCDMNSCISRVGPRIASCPFPCTRH
jgi:hypothetical protein